MGPLPPTPSLLVLGRTRKSVQVLRESDGKRTLRCCSECDLAGPVARLVPPRKTSRMPSGFAFDRRSRRVVSHLLHCGLLTAVRLPHLDACWSSRHACVRACPSRPQVRLPASIGLPSKPHVHICPDSWNGVEWAHQLGRRRQRRSTSTCGMNLSTRQRRSASKAPPRCLR